MGDVLEGGNFRGGVGEEEGDLGKKLGQAQGVQGKNNLEDSAVESSEVGS